MLKRFLVVLVISTLCFPAIIFAETIVLKSGQTVEGKLIEKNDKYVKIDFYGVPLTYFFDEVKSIDGASPSLQTAPEISIQKTGSETNTAAEFVLSGNKIENSDSGKKIIDPDEKTKVRQFLEKDNINSQNMASGVMKEMALMMQANAKGDKKEVQLIAGRIRDLMSQQKKDYEAIAVPPLCNELKSLKINFFQLQTEEYDALSKGDAEKAKSLQLETKKTYDKMEEETNKIFKAMGVNEQGVGLAK